MKIIYNKSGNKPFHKGKVKILLIIFILLSIILIGEVNIYAQTNKAQYDLKTDKNKKVIQVIGKSYNNNFAAIVYNNVTYEYYLISGNDKYGPYDEIDDLQFSPDGKTLAYKVKIKK